MTRSTSTFTARLTEVAGMSRQARGLAIRRAGVPARSRGPQRLMAAMRHAALGGGKRLRPFLTSRRRGCSGATGAGPCGRAAPSSCCIAIPSSTTTCRPWTTTTCGAAGRPCTRPSTRRPRSWPATRCRPWPSRFWPIRRPTPIRRSAPTWSSASPARRASAAWSAARCSTSRPRGATARRPLDEARSAGSRR